MSEGVEDLSAYPKAKDPMAASFAATTAAAVLKAPIVSISQSLAQAPPPPPPTHTNSRVVPPSAVVTTNNNVVAPPPPLPMPVKTTPTATSSSKYSQLLAVIEDMGRDIRPTYAGSKSSVERIKRHIVHARILIMATTSNGLRTLYTVDTVYSADVVEWCPNHENGHILFIGTYQLDDGAKNGESPAKRMGRRRCLRIGRDPLTGEVLLREHLATEEVAAILDAKWSRSNADLLCTVDAIGCVNVIDIAANTTNKIQVVSGGGGLALSVDWSTAISHRQPEILTSDSLGQLSVVDPEAGTVINQWKAHDYEAWIAAYNPHDTNIVYSGGDDTLLRGWDKRSPDKPIFTSKAHQMGVCSIQQCSTEENLLATGSYDEQILFWDPRSMRQPLHEVGVDGGVWRIKFDHSNSDQLVAACMHNGFHVITNIKEKPRISASYMEHTSLAYGVDWCRLNVGQLPEVVAEVTALEELPAANTPLGVDTRGHCDLDARILASCSFYDHSLHVWTLPSTPAPNAA